MNTTAVRSAALVLAVTLLAPACGDDQDPTGANPVPGELAIMLTAPAGANDGAALLLVSGPHLPDPATVRATDSEALALFAHVSGNTMRVAVFGDVSSGSLVVFPTSDVNVADQYTVTLLELAATDHTLRAELRGYAVSVNRVED